jgi:hypothetical protein
VLGEFTASPATGRDHRDHARCSHGGRRTDGAEEMKMLEEVRVTETEEIETFLADLRGAGIDPGFLAVLPALNATGGHLSSVLYRLLDVIRSDASLCDRARRIGTILGQVIAHDVRKF